MCIRDRSYITVAITFTVVVASLYRLYFTKLFLAPPPDPVTIPEKGELSAFAAAINDSKDSCAPKPVKSQYFSTTLDVVAPAARCFFVVIELKAISTIFENSNVIVDVFALTLTPSFAFIRRVKFPA